MDARLRLPSALYCARKRLFRLPSGLYRIDPRFMTSRPTNAFTRSGPSQAGVFERLPPPLLELAPPLLE